jgi:spermidine synthase
MEELVRTRFAPERREALRWFFVGGGAYTLPRSVRANWPQAPVTVAELDPMVTRTAVDRLFLDTAGMTVVHADARAVLARDAGAYDVMVGDAFHDISIPYHLVTREFAAQIKARLAPDGIYLANVIDAFPDARLTKAMVKTLRTVFAHVDVWIERLPEAPSRITLVISASDSHTMPDTVTAEAGYPRRWFRVTEPLERAGTPMADLPLLSDDYAPVERLVASFFFEEMGL